ncbi:hypothetical protein QJS10_CPB12g00372 [Acorus calamus]|uniref:Uncharacterized protein n=1 Tax=Acorus calamus TaxID=4465 RepID=A0AAV9DPX3_ACOCL|nr:hypothetical protein QJS10_CPB12g00372 [Acorus calamus]
MFWIEENRQELQIEVAELPETRCEAREPVPRGADSHSRTPLQVGEQVVKDRTTPPREDRQRDQELLEDSVQKHARQLKVDANSPTFQDAVRRFWMPRLLQKMGPNSVLSPTTTTTTTTVAIPTTTMTESDKKNQISESNCGSSNSSELAQFPEFATDACDGFYDMGFMFYDVMNSAQAAPPPDHEFFVGGGAAGDGGLWIMDESWEEL